ncbi:MAG: hypothetical protein WBQ03_14730 [Candidatus Sulfotelmatobacter sp.]
MKRVAWAIFFVGLLLNAAAIGQSQAGNSLADVARANRAKQQAEEAAGSTPKVITNQNLPSAPPDITESSEPMTTVSGVRQFAESYSDQHVNQRLLAEERSGQYWKPRIENQEARIADLQARIDRVNQSMHAAVGTAQYETPVNRYQSIQMERLAHMQEMLDQQQRRLSMMQDAARLTGMGQ